MVFPRFLLRLLAAFVLAGASATLAGAELFPSHIAAGQLRADRYYQVFDQFLQLPNGDTPAEVGKVLVQRIENGFELAFYREETTGYVRIDEPVQFLGTKPPHRSALSDPGVTCLRAFSRDGTRVLFAYVERDHVVVKETRH